MQMVSGIRQEALLLPLGDALVCCVRNRKSLMHMVSGIRQEALLIPPELVIQTLTPTTLVHAGNDRRMQGIGSPSEPPRTGRPSCVLGDGQLPTKLVSYGLHSKSDKHFSRLTVQLLLQSGRLYPSLLCILNNKQSWKLARN